MFQTDDLEETVIQLIKQANPEGSNYRKLIGILNQIRRNVFLGPKTRKYINECVEKLDNIECEGFLDAGLCTLIPGRGQCNVQGNFSQCTRYVPVRPSYKRGAIVLGGGDE